jgi:hypothetical protein
MDTSWPTTQTDLVDAITILYVAGYTSASDVPQGLKAAMKFLISHWNENREAVTVGAVARPIEFAVEALCLQYKVPNVY